MVYAGHCHLLGPRDVALGWLVVEPKRHVVGLEDLTAEQAAAIGVLTSRLARALRSVAGDECVYSLSSGDGLATGHLHVHLMARYPGTPKEYLGTRVVEWPDGRRGGAEAVRALVAELCAERARQASSVRSPQESPPRAARREK